MAGGFMRGGARAETMAQVQASWKAMKVAIMTAESTTAVWSSPHWCAQGSGGLPAILTKCTAFAYECMLGVIAEEVTLLRTARAGRSDPVG